MSIVSEEKTEARIGSMLLDIYRPRFELAFAAHPNRKEIVDMLCMGGNPPELVELWFAEAEAFLAEAFKPAAYRGARRQVVSRIGDQLSQKFEIVRGDN